MIPELAGFDEERLDTLIREFKSLHIAVLGDYFLDKYFDIDPSLAEISLETGLPAHQVVQVRHSPGAAGTVMNNLSALEAGTLTAIGSMGDDGEGYELRQDLLAQGVDIQHLHIEKKWHTPLYLKPRDISKKGLAGEHPRYDIQNHIPLSPRTEEALIGSLRAVLPQIDALIVMDQVEKEGLGTVTPHIREHLNQILPSFPHLIVWADSRRHIHRFRRMIRKMNQFELLQIPNPEPDTRISEKMIREALLNMRSLSESSESEPLTYVTVGEQGVWVGGKQPVRVPAIHIEGPVDPTGAGDSFSAGAVLALAAKGSPVEAALIGNLVASVTVRQLSTTGTARPGELFTALKIWKEQQK
jgi:bifunctional ADP-heptose synthase (sugar kinase/adenylyltransferase)